MGHLHPEPASTPGLDFALSTFLDADPNPTFIIPIHSSLPISFDILFCNQAFRDAFRLRADVVAENDAARRFRSWAQATNHWRDVAVFANRSWSAFTVLARYKCVRVVGTKPASSSQCLPHSCDSSAHDLAARLSNPTSQILEARRLTALQKMMEMSDVGVFEYETTGKLIQANNAWYRLSSHPRDLDAHQDFSFMDLVYPPDVPLVMSKWNSLIQGEPVTFEMRWKGKPSSLQDHQLSADVQWVLSACVPLMDDAGELVSIAGNTIDISAQKRCQEEAMQRAETLEKLRASEHRFARFAELAPVGIYIYDHQKELEYCNDKFFEMTGHPRVPYTAVDWSALVYPEDLGLAYDFWKIIFEQKIPAQTEFRLNKTWIGSDGIATQAWGLASAHPELKADGSIRSVMGTLTDISQWKWAESVQRVRFEEAIEAKRQQENFIDMTSHEMRNPLSAVIQCADSTIESLTQLLAQATTRDPPLPQDDLDKFSTDIRSCLDALQTIISCSLHQKRIIDDILTLSKLDSNLILITPDRVQPVAVVAEAVKMFELECAKDDIALALQQDPSLKEVGADWVMLDPSRLLQVLINLLTNAIKFTRDRPIRQIVITLGAAIHRPSRLWDRSIKFTSQKSTSETINKPEWGNGRKAYIWVKVEDTGCGLTVAEQGNLFTRFSQATPRTHVRYGGSGLGLFISKSLTELQGGAIGVRSEADVGSTFAFYVGTRISAPPIPELHRSSSKALELVFGTDEPMSRPRYALLIVEDNIVNQKVLSSQLEKAGCDVYVAGHGEEALSFLKQTKFWIGQESTGKELDLVLMDIEMPVMDGLTCAKMIREAERRGEVCDHVPILAVSANARSEQIKQAVDAGMDDAIAKPFRIHELLPKIDLLTRKLVH